MANKRSEGKGTNNQGPQDQPESSIEFVIDAVHYAMYRAHLLTPSELLSYLKRRKRIFEEIRQKHPVELSIDKVKLLYPDESKSIQWP